MIIIRIDGTHGDYYSPDELSPYEIDRAKGAGVDALVYEYSSGSYEGSGHALLWKNGEWAYADLGHCSCYGPLENAPDQYEPLATLKSRMHQDVLQAVQPLLDEIEKRGLDLT